MTDVSAFGFLFLTPKRLHFLKAPASRMFRCWLNPHGAGLIVSMLHQPGLWLHLCSRCQCSVFHQHILQGFFFFASLAVQAAQLEIMLKQYGWSKGAINHQLDKSSGNHRQPILTVFLTIPPFALSVFWQIMKALMPGQTYSIYHQL